MFVKTYTAQRLILNDAEKLVKKSWGTHFANFKKKYDKKEKIKILFGEWSGYTSSQKRIVHVDVGLEDVKGYKTIGSIKYSDGTYLNVWQEQITLNELFERNITRKQSYTELINKLIKSGEKLYLVE